LTPPARRAALRDALAAIWRNPIVLFGMSGLVLCSALPAVAATWIPSILIRVHDFSLQEAGFGGALIQIATAIGAGCGGVIADWLGRKEGWRRLLAAVFGCSSALIIGLIALFAAPNGAAAVALLALMGFLNAFHGGVGFAVVLGNVVPWVRSTVLAVLLIAQNLIAVALVNTLVGVISDWTAGAFGQSSILLGMGSMLFLNVGGVLAFWIAMRAIRRAEEAPGADPSR
jgi:MFS family permease